MVLEKVAELREIQGDRKEGFMVAVDGGITLENARAVKAAGINSLIIGSGLLRLGEKYASEAVIRNRWKTLSEMTNNTQPGVIQ